MAKDPALADRAGRTFAMRLAVVRTGALQSRKSASPVKT
jgi:hypothetical protein